MTLPLTGLEDRIACAIDLFIGARDELHGEPDHDDCAGHEPAPVDAALIQDRQLPAIHGGRNNA